MEQKVITFGIKEIKTVDWRIKDRSVDSNNASFQIDASFEVIAPSKSIEVDIQVKIAENGFEREPLLSLTTKIRFEIVNFDKLTGDKTEKIFLPDAFLATIIGLAISTTRGMLVEKTAGTSLSVFILPVINPMDIVKDMAKIKD